MGIPIWEQGANKTTSRGGILVCMRVACLGGFTNLVPDDEQCVVLERIIWGVGCGTVSADSPL